MDGGPGPRPAHPRPLRCPRRGALHGTGHPRRFLLPLPDGSRRNPGGEARPRLAPRLHRSGARRGVLGQEVQQHESRRAGWRQLEPPRDPAAAAQSGSCLREPRLRPRRRGGPPRCRRVRLRARSHRRRRVFNRPRRLRPLRSAKPPARRHRGQEERHQPLRRQATGPALRAGARRPLHLPDQRRTDLLLGLPERRRPPHRRLLLTAGPRTDGGDAGDAQAARHRRDSGALHPPGGDAHMCGPTRPTRCRRSTTRWSLAGGAS